jgi:plastocyanin
MILLRVIKIWTIFIVLTLSFVISLTTLLNLVLAYAERVETSAKLVHAGQGNATNIEFAFIPQNVVIKTGDSITWDNPNFYAEPHSVSFLNEVKYFPEFVVPFNVTNSTNFVPSDTETNADPLFLTTDPGLTTKKVAMINARAFNPVVIDSSGNKVTFLQPNSNYAMGGNESLVNSGWLWPEGQSPPGSPSISNFTITFENPGTYSYMCNVHPWMSGSVKVN